MNFDELQISELHKSKYISKKFYGKYFCKLVLKIDQSEVQPITMLSVRPSPFHKYEKRSNQFKLLGILVRDVKKIIRNDDYRFRSESDSLSIFTNDVNDLNALMHKFPANFTEIQCPINSNHCDLLDKHTTVVVRNILFDKRFRFKIYLKADYKLRENRYNEVKSYLENIIDHALNRGLNQFFKTNMRSRSIGWTSAVYLNDPSDLMMFHLKFNNDIQKIEEAVLISSL